MQLARKVDGIWMQKKTDKRKSAIAAIVSYSYIHESDSAGSVPGADAAHRSGLGLNPKP